MADDLSRPKCSRWSWMPWNFHDPADVFRRSSASERKDEDLNGVELERIPDPHILPNEERNSGGQEAYCDEIDIHKLCVTEKKMLMDHHTQSC